MQIKMDEMLFNHWTFHQSKKEHFKCYNLIFFNRLTCSSRAAKHICFSLIEMSFFQAHKMCGKVPHASTILNSIVVKWCVAMCATTTTTMLELLCLTLCHKISGHKTVDGHGNRRVLRIFCPSKCTIAHKQTHAFTWGEHLCQQRYHFYWLSTWITVNIKNRSSMIL